jgi:membrane protein implicated in regulation of membrane protease activity
MNEILATAMGALLVALLLLQFAEAIASAVAAGFVGAVRWIQKHYFDIDHPRAGAEALIGRRVQAHEGFSVSDESGLLEGYVVLDGERWRARIVRGTGPDASGECLSVVRREGLVLCVSQVAGE